MKKYYIGVSILSIIAITISLVALVLSGQKNIDVAATITQDAQQNTLRVVGEAETAVVPDTASVSLTITHKSPNLTRATQSVNERIAKLVDALKRSGIEEKNIKTKNYTVAPEYNWADGKQHFTGYRVAQELVVEIHDLAKTQTVLAQIDTFNIDAVSQLRFYTDDDRAIRDALRKDAIADAKKKAQQLAKDLDVSLGALVSFHEGRDESGVFAPQVTMFREQKALAASEPTVPVGENDYHVMVTLVYKIR